MTIFALAARPWIREAFGDATLDQLLTAAVLRLQTRFPRTERVRDAIVVNADAYSAAVQLLATEEPYLLDEGLMFLPFPCRSGPTVEDAIQLAEEVRVLPVLRWYGSLESSRLMLAAGDTLVAAGAVSLEPRGHHVYYARATEDDDVVTLANGEPMHRWRSFPVAVFVARKSAPTQSWQLVLFEDARGIVYFSRGPVLYGIDRTTLIHAEMRGVGRSIAFIERPPDGFRPPTPANLTVVLTHRYQKATAIVATGDRDALVVFGDQLREALAGSKVVIGIAEPGESTKAFYARVEASLSA